MEDGKYGILFSYWLANKRITTYHKRQSGFVHENQHCFVLQPVGMEPGKYEMRGGRGDCTLTLLTTEMKIDDGVWECQVRENRMSSL
jgi:hypothetical protein